MKWFIMAFKKYAQFDGRSRRSEYWYFVLFVTLISIALTMIEVTLGIAGFLSMGWSLVTLVPSIAVAIRRMHDVGKSGWFILIPIYNLILAFTAGETGPNQYGPDPKNPDLDIASNLIEY